MSDTRRTVLITGATAGIGYETARRLADHGADVILHARTSAEGEQALDALVETGVDPRRLDVAGADFSRLSEVAELAEQVRARHPRIDVLINNAALAGTQSRIITRDGNELTFQVNYLAPYLLTRLLWQPLTAGQGGRVVNLSSALHRTAELHWNDLGQARRYTPSAAYAQSKLALTLFTRGLAEYGRSGPTGVAVHPGIIASGVLARYGRHGAPVTEGAAVVVDLASPGVAVVNGGYYDRLTLTGPAAIVRDRAAVGRLWRLSAHLTGLDGAGRPLRETA